MNPNDLTPALDALLRSRCTRLAQQGMTPGVPVALGALLCGVAGVAVVAGGAGRLLVLCLPVALLVRAAALRLGAMLDSEHHLGTPGNALLQEIGALVSEVALFWPLAWAAGLQQAWLVTFCCLLALLTEFAGTVGMTLGASRRRDGPMDSSTRAWTLALLCLIMGLGGSGRWWVHAGLQVLPFLQGWTIVRRLRGALAEVQSKAAAASTR